MLQNKFIIGDHSVIMHGIEDVENVNPREYLLKSLEQMYSSYIEEILLLVGMLPIRNIPEMIKVGAHVKAEETLKYHEGLDLPEQLKCLLENELKKNEQVSLLKGITLKEEQTPALYLLADKLGYKLSIYRFEDRPKKYKNADLPPYIHINEDGSVEHAGNTEFSEGQLKEIVDVSKFVLAIFFIKDKHWHCFYQTKRGIMGKEPGQYGRQSHMHYVSDSFGLEINDVIRDFKNGKCPKSEVHIVFEDEVENVDIQ